MEQTRLDVLARRLAQANSRRDLLKACVGVLVGGLAASAVPHLATAANSCQACNGLPPGPARGRCHSSCAHQGGFPAGCITAQLCPSTGRYTCCTGRGTACCNGQCAALLQDSQNCGACGNVCGFAIPCVGGQCAGGSVCGTDICKAGETCCGGDCADLATGSKDEGATETKHCGSCFTTCVDGQACVNGACVCDPTCGGCCNNGICVSPVSDQFCGSKGSVCHACAPSERCVAGSCCPLPQVCGSVCCPLGQSCLNGACHCTAQSCSGGCCHGDTCVPPVQQTSSLCGSGGGTCQACSGTQVCQSGACVCPSGTTSCGGNCCTTNQTCVNGACASSSTGSCVPGQLVCGPPSGGVCVNGVCQCQTGQIACGNSAAVAICCTPADCGTDSQGNQVCQSFGG